MRPITVAPIRAAFARAGMVGGRRSAAGAATGIILVPASPPVEAATAEQKHNDDDDENSLHIRISPLTKASLVHTGDQWRNQLPMRGGSADLFLQGIPCLALDFFGGAGDPVSK